LQLNRHWGSTYPFRMPDCPLCALPLKTTRYRDGLIFVCPICDGRAVTIPQIRRVAGDRFATALLRQINRSVQLGERACPFCYATMRLLHPAEPSLDLDACKQCGVVWFDPGEFGSIPEGAVESPEEARLRGMEVLAQHKLDVMRERGLTDEEPDESWKTIPALFGFPVESETDPLSRWPWFTWSLAAVIAMVSIGVFFDLEPAIHRFGLVPAEWWRIGGLTLLTSFFLHGGIWHLVGNLYFLLIFGDNVEDYLGRWRYALLILAATVVGDGVHILAQHHSPVPCIGASGGISGVIVFYALQFPRARLGFLFRYWFHFRWIQIPAWGALALWLVLQSFGVFSQLNGFSEVAATAHLGGAAVGFGLWLWWRNREKRPLLDIQSTHMSCK
jgi:membrane associated rhomboid family serine protease/Zn-finger nucleic acid-binding protein